MRLGIALATTAMRRVAAGGPLWTARADLTNNTVDPGAFTIGNARNWAAATVAVFQRAP